MYLYIQYISLQTNTNIYAWWTVFHFVKINKVGSIHLFGHGVIRLWSRDPTWTLCQQCDAININAYDGTVLSMRMGSRLLDSHRKLANLTCFRGAFVKHYTYRQKDGPMPNHFRAPAPGPGKTSRIWVAVLETMDVSRLSNWFGDFHKWGYLWAPQGWFISWKKPLK